MNAYQPSRAILPGTRMFENTVTRLGGKTQLYRLYTELDLFWNVGKFSPSPESKIQAMFPEAHLTKSEILHLILAWQESRTRHDFERRG